MDSDYSSSSSSSASPPSLRRKLRTTVCGCFGSPSQSGGEKTRSSNNGARWRRRVVATGEFGYDPLSYALNFDDGSGAEASDDSAESATGFRYRNFNARLPRSPARSTAVAIA